jgi:YgiT-type zinc finger domain-containing protein
MALAQQWKETLVEQRVTYTLELDGRFIIIEKVPARVNVETGERFFSPETVERLQQMVWEEKPSRVVETPVYEFAL